MAAMLPFDQSDIDEDDEIHWPKRIKIGAQAQAEAPPTLAAAAAKPELKLYAIVVDVSIQNPTQCLQNCMFIFPSHSLACHISFP